MYISHSYDDLSMRDRFNCNECLNRSCRSVLGLCALTLIAGLIACTVLFWGLPAGIGSVGGLCAIFILGVITYLICCRQNRCTGSSGCNVEDMIGGILTGCLCLCCASAFSRRV
ncbi:hypothetical protein CLAVI_000487 [Candidatus Clavichlamydia salmonicola]|uniref:hypothetical protein n=1 Tax=Candidatus Clavichlamydia salmonicola TaxID=469812 RepID=UPI001890DC40|nr:hypothetical protein [Candidatus Clavichlamydia salmonicola]MBF5050865.1 hypothetical protein [Candidatus Clavichlamydia salmonicola]